MNKALVLAPLALALISSSAYAVPVVPNFTQGSQTSRTQTTSKVSESINSVNYNTGFTYTVTGTGIVQDGGIAPTSQEVIGEAGGFTAKWTGLDLRTKPTFRQATPGGAFQFTESYIGPGLSNQTIINRTTEIESITDSVSIFTQ